jgi:phospholipase/lecithinase/hemolysin
VKSIVVSAVAEVPAVSTAAATRMTVFGSTYSYVDPART